MDIDGSFSVDDGITIDACSFLVTSTAAGVSNPSCTCSTTGCTAPTEVNLSCEGNGFVEDFGCIDVLAAIDDIEAFFDE